MRNILEIYEEYKILPILEMHQLRVASVVSLILDNLKIDSKIGKEDLITAALLHDMGNIAKMQLNVFPKECEPEGVEYWEKVKEEFCNKYGFTDHEATTNILKGLNANQEVIDLIDSIGHTRFCDQLKETNIARKIINYADTRVGPFGVLSYEDRMQEVSVRYRTYKTFIGEEKHQIAVACGKEIENQIFANCKIKPEDITDESISEILEKMKKYMIK